MVGVVVLRRWVWGVWMVVGVFFRYLSLGGVLFDLLLVLGKLRLSESIILLPKLMMHRQTYFPRSQIFPVLISFTVSCEPWFLLYD